MSCGVDRSKEDEMTDNLVLQMAKLNITFNGENGDLPDLVSYDATDADIRQMATESVRYGYVPGIEANALANFDNFVVERYPAKEDVPFNRIVLRPKSEFGGLGRCGVWDDATDEAHGCTCWRCRKCGGAGR